MRRAGVLAHVTLALCTASVLGAQAPSDRLALLQWRDSLTQERDSAALRRMVLATRAEARAARDNPLLHLRRGFGLLRLAELDDARDFDEAASEFEWATQLQPDWPYSWLGKGLAELGIADQLTAVEGALDGLIGDGALELSVRALVRSATIDPTFVEDVRAVAEVAIASRSAVQGDIALRTLRELASKPAGKTPQLLLARGRIEREFGTPVEALVPLEQFLALQPGSAIGLLELGRTRFMLGRLDGVDPWFDGLGQASGAALAQYRGDLSPLAVDSLLVRFDRGTPAERVAAVRRYWAEQDPDGLPATAERMRDHYLRLDYARRHFLIPPAPPSVTEVTLGLEPALDDRGLIYVRHGPPDERATASMIGVRPNESWSYHPSDGPELLFHFILFDEAVGYRQYHSLLDILARSNQFRWYADHGGRDAAADTMPRTLHTYGAELSAQIAQALMLSRWNTSPLYRRMLGEGKGRADSLQALERAVGDRSAALAGSWSLRYELPLQAQVQVLAVGHESTGGTVQVVYSVRASGVIDHLISRGNLYRLRIRAAVVDSLGKIVAVADTTRDFISPMALAPGDHLNGRLPLAVPPGKYHVRVAIESDMHGSITPRQEILVSSPAATTLSLSDLALGARSVRLGWRPQPNDTAWVNPLRRFSLAEPMQLYFEVTGVGRGESYQTNLAIFRLSGDSAITHRSDAVVTAGGTPALSLGFSETHPGGVASVRREISLQRLKPGEYVLQVTLARAGEPKVVRRQAFVVTR